MSLPIQAERVQPGAQRLHECLAESLRERIFAHRLRPGSTVDEVALCRHYGVPRAVLQAALRLLVADGLLLARSAGGFSVWEARAEDLVRLCELLAQLDSHVLGALAARSPAEVAAVLEDCRRAATPGAAAEAAPVDSQAWLECLRCAGAAASAPVFALLTRQLRRQLQLALGPQLARIERAAWLEIREPLSRALLQRQPAEIGRLCRLQGQALQAAIQDAYTTSP